MEVSCRKPDLNVIDYYTVEEKFAGSRFSLHQWPWPHYRCEQGNITCLVEIKFLILKTCDIKIDVWMNEWKWKKILMKNFISRG